MLMNRINWEVTLWVGFWLLTAGIVLFAGYAIYRDFHPVGVRANVPFIVESHSENTIPGGLFGWGSDSDCVVALRFEDGSISTYYVGQRTYILLVVGKRYVADFWDETAWQPEGFGNLREGSEE
jgi:hypothetical protein